MLYSFILLLVFSNAFGDLVQSRKSRQSEYNCVTPDNLYGICINIKNCPTLYELLTTRGREPAVANYLRRSQCGLEYNVPKVCCANPQNTAESTSASNYETSPPPVTPSTTVQKPHKPTKTKDFSICGKSERKAVKITGGNNATLGDWPWMVAIGYRSATNPGPLFRCGGSLISNRWVLTAAHCVQNIGSLTLTTVRMGDLDLNDNNVDGAAPVTTAVDAIIPHPEYKASPVINDIALLRLKDPVTFTMYLRPVCILKEDEHRSDGFYARKRPFISGWGSTEWRGPSSTLLQEAQIDIVDRESCARSYANQKAVIDHRVLCASAKGKDSCQGDSGGPLIIPLGATYYLAGIVSYGVRCADSNFPGVYTRVAQFSDWIKRTTGV